VPSSFERPVRSSDAIGEQIVKRVQETRDAVAAHQLEVARLNVASPFFDPLVKTGRNARKSFGTMAKRLAADASKLKKTEELRSELTLEAAYHVICAAERDQPTIYDGFIILDRLLKVSDLIQGAYNELPNFFSLGHRGTHRLRTCWVYTAISLYRAALQPIRVDRARKIFKLLAAGRIDDLTAYFYACALNSTSQTSDYTAPKLRSCLVELLLMQAVQLEQRYGMITDILLALQASGPTEKAENQRDALVSLLRILAADLSRLEVTARVYATYKPPLLFLHPARAAE